jgi:hypothetical protein
MGQKQGMELAAHWHRCQTLQKTSDCFLQQYTGGEMIVSRRVGEPILGQKTGILSSLSCDRLPDEYSRPRTVAICHSERKEPQP